jgi:hypothetical protein
MVPNARATLQEQLSGILRFGAQWQNTGVLATECQEAFGAQWQNIGVLATPCQEHLAWLGVVFKN